MSILKSICDLICGPSKPVVDPEEQKLREEAPPKEVQISAIATEMLMLEQHLAELDRLSTQQVKLIQTTTEALSRTVDAKRATRARLHHLVNLA